MTSKMNWACNTCGMASGRRQSVQRHIANPRIRGGNAIAVSFVEYLAGLTAGLYPRPYGIHNHHLNARAVGAFRVHEEQPKESFFDKIQEKVQEKMIERIAEEMANPASSSPPPFFSMQKIPISQPPPFRYPGEDIFGIGGYICPQCLVIKPIIFSYCNASNDRPTHSLVYPTQFCSGASDLRSPQERTEYM